MMLWEFYIINYQFRSFGDVYRASSVIIISLHVGYYSWIIIVEVRKFWIFVKLAP